MLARTSAMHTFSEFFVGKPTAADPDLWQHVEHAPPIDLYVGPGMSTGGLRRY